jgi:2-C-methyl-D-erythritol 4-phosphate cytidylyltransferase / 2-C-methyl-D-erythritol 2,4-cyclodiphosphate synthase
MIDVTRYEPGLGTVALIVAAGKGERAGGGLPKQYAVIAGKSLLAHSVEAFAAHPGISGIVLAIGAGQQDMAKTALAGRQVLATITGGAERQDSVRAGLDAILALGGASNVLIHDAARPFLPARVIDRLIEVLETHVGAVPAMPVVDSLARANGTLGETVDRNSLFRVQTPQAFRLDAIMTSHRTWQGLPATDDAQMARKAGFDIALVDGDPMLPKHGWRKR